MITNDMLKAFRNDFNIAMKSLEEKYGCSIELGRLTYSTNEFHGKVTGFKKVGGKSKEQMQFESSCHLYNLKPDDYGKEVEVDSKKYILVGLNTRAPKYPYVIQDITSGNTYRASNIKFI